MKRHIITALLFAVPVLLPAQVPTQNYVKSTQMLDGGRSLNTIQYYDGLGRPFEKVLQNITPTHSNLVYLTEYDDMGREGRQWLPAVSGQIFMEPSSVASAVASSHGNDTHAYTENHYDGSPLNRIVAQDMEGADWVGHPVTTEYLTNTQQMPLACIDYSVSGNALQTGSFYPTGTLQVIKTTDVAGNVCYIFTDMQKHKVLERRMDGNMAHDTYYVYDQRGDLRFVLQPMYQNDADLEKYAFLYKYDDRHNVIEKQLPGCQPIRYVYDRANHLILSQDGRQRSSGKAAFMLYDKLGRMVLKGICNCPSLPSLRNTIITVSYNGTQSGFCSTGYTDCSWPLYNPNPQVEAAYYYDDYRFARSGIFTTPGISTGINNVQGLLTGEITSFSDEIQKTCAVYQYDEKGRQIKTVKCNILNGIENITTTYSLTDKPLTVTHEFQLNNRKTTERQIYSYDHADRLVSITHKLDNLPQVTLAENTYDNLCRLSSKKIMGEQVTYKYNVRDWLTGITSSHYLQNQAYDLNGNIKLLQWKRDGERAPQVYAFTYDGLSRLKKAEYAASGKLKALSARYSYDLNGNITELYRNAPDDDGNTCLLDELAMTYNGNQLLQVDNNSDDDDITDGVRYNGGNLLTYDENGCLTKDMDKNISSIQYNSLNLPTYMKLSIASAHVSYKYDSKGNKLQETRVSLRPKRRHETSYCDNFVFENGTLKRILVEGGFIYFGENDTTYHYFLKDHLGSNRAVVNAKTGQVVEKYDYYPFGKQHGDYHTGYIHPYRYNGKELENAMGIDWLYYGARMMEPEWGRFTTPDPLAEKYYDVSPYAYCGNNPMIIIDPDGMDNYVLNRDGNIVLLEINNDETNTIYAQVGKGSINRQKSVIVSKSFLESKDSKTYKGRRQSGESKSISNFSVDFYSSEDEQESNAFFEFAAENTDVEWSNTRIESSNKGKNIIATSHSERSEMGQRVIFEGAYGMDNQQSTIVYGYHSHNPFSVGMSGGDISLAKLSAKKYPNAVLKIYDGISYTKFDHNMQPGMIEEIMVKGHKPAKIK
jgi:RHS repeat-associated protein